MTHRRPIGGVLINVKAARVSLYVLAALVAVALTAVVSCEPLMAFHDRNTRQDVSAVVARELPIGAPLGDVKAFLERRTTRFALDDAFHHVYGGFLPQTWLDRFLFNRQVQVNLYLDDGHRFKRAEVNVSYTFL
jgi:hypothetical protein